MRTGLGMAIHLAVNSRAHSKGTDRQYFLALGSVHEGSLDVEGNLYEALDHFLDRWTGFPSTRPG